MEILYIVAFALTSSLLYIILKEVQAGLAFLLVFITTIIILLYLIEQLQMVLATIHLLASKAAIESYYLQIIFKVIGIAYVIEISSNLIQDSGLSSLASKVELAGKIIILLLALPVIQAVIELIIQFIPTGSGGLLTH